jgi:hypothetical protein
MAWKGTRPPVVTGRDNRIEAYLKEHGPSSRNQIASPPAMVDGKNTGGLGISKSLTYLSLDRLRKAGKVKRCMSEDSNELLWTTETEKPCP